MCVRSTIKLIFRTRQKQKRVIGVNMAKVLLYIYIKCSRARSVLSFVKKLRNIKTWCSCRYIFPVLQSTL